MISCLHTHFFVQVRRLFRLIYHSRHFYLIHVDSRQDYLQRQVAALAEEVSHSASLRNQHLFWPYPKFLHHHFLLPSLLRH